MGDPLQSAAPKISGDKKSAADTANGEGQQQPAEERPPRRRNPPWKWLGLTKSKWRELLAILLLVPWIYYEFIDAHGIIKLFLLALTLSIAQGIVSSFWGINSKTISFWLFSLVPIAVVVWINSRPVEQYPNLKLSISDTPDFKDALPLTNDFLFTQSQTKFLINGVLCIPVEPGQSNVFLSVGIKNDSSVFAQYPQVSIATSEPLECAPDFRWIEKSSSFINGDEATSCWGFRLSPITKDDGGQATPQFSVKVCPVNDWEVFGIEISSEYAGQEKRLTMKVMFIPKSPYKHPFIAPITTDPITGKRGIAPLDIPQ